MPEFTFTKAKRKAVPMLISISSVSGGGKTYSALLMAAGLAGSSGRVGFLDTENGRGEMYTDSPGILAALPQGFEYARLDPPFAPANYISGITAAEKAGINVLIIDSTTHEWEGIGGACEIAEKNKLGGMPNWSKAKMEHKKFVNHCLSTSMHLIFCIRARDKVKMVKAGDIRSEGDGGRYAESAVIPLGIMPICEKNFVFEMLLSLQLDEKTHVANPIKVPEPLVPLFSDTHLITKDDGIRIAQWNATGERQGNNEQLFKRARSAAETGMDGYSSYYQQLEPSQKKVLRDTVHEEMKRIAQEADAENQGGKPLPEAQRHTPAPAALPPIEMDFVPGPDDGVPGQEALVGGHSWVKQDSGEWKDMGKVRGAK